MIVGSGFAVGNATAVRIGGVAVHGSTWDATALDDSARVLISVAPPGFGDVSVVVTVGNRSASLAMRYASPVLPPVAFYVDPKRFNLADGSAATNFTSYGFTIRGSNLPACAFCLALASRQLEGCPTAACALPASAGLDDATITINGSVAHVYAVDGLDNAFVRVTTSETGPGASVVVAFGGAPILSAPPFSFSDLIKDQPSIRSIMPPSGTLESTQSPQITFEVVNLLQTSDPTLVSSRIIIDTLISSDLRIACPLVWGTVVFTEATATDASMPELLGVRNGAVTIIWANGTASHVVDTYSANATLTSAGALFRTTQGEAPRVWLVHDVLPCFAVRWMTASAVGLSGTIVAQLPRWTGQIKVRLESGDAQDLNDGVLWSFPLPVIRNIQGTFGSSEGSLVGITGEHLGGRSAAALWDDGNCDWNRPSTTSTFTALVPTAAGFINFVAFRTG